jgi:hypothetical protein
MEGRTWEQLTFAKRFMALAPFSGESSMDQLLMLNFAEDESWRWNKMRVAQHVESNASASLSTSQDTDRLRINFPFRCFCFGLRTWAAAALIWAEREHTWAEPKQNLSMPEQSLNPEPSWTHFGLLCRGYSFLTELCPGIRFWSLATRVTDYG